VEPHNGTARPTVVNWNASARLAATAVLSVLSLAGCGSGAGVASGDCAAALRVDSTTFVEAGSTRQAASRAGQAERALCEDVGADARGIYFPEQPDPVDVWSFDGQDPRDVLGVRRAGGRYDFYIAADLSDSERAKVVGALEDES
jgi:hypothetical protein